MKFNKTLIAISLASALSACGSSSSDPKDTTAPNITLSGNSSITIDLNATYVDAGATAIDDVDGAIAVTTTGTVDQSTAGVYTLTYTATDAAGNVSTETRTVTVITPPTPTTVTGQAVKGVLANAKVTVYKFNENGDAVALDPATELRDGEVTTDGSGNYSFVVIGGYEGPIKVELSPSTDPANPTTMICDAPAGCGDTAFGAAIDLTVADPNFKLAAISVVESESSGEVKMNVSALTHLAAELIEADDAGVTAGTVTEQSTKVASTFGIEGDITQLEATVTTDAEAVAGEDNEAELRLGLINAGIMAAMFSGETDDAAVLSSKLTKIASDLIDNNGALLVNQDEEKDGFELAVSDVLEGAGDAAAAAGELIEADDTITGTDEILGELAQEETNLANEKAYQESNVGEDGLSEVVTEQPTEGDAVTKAKAMVEDVRLFTQLFEKPAVKGDGISGQGDEYLALMDTASAMIKTEANSFDLLAKVSDALAELSLQHDNGTLTAETSSAGIDISTLITGATGTVTFDENTSTGGVLFNVSATVGSDVVALNSTAEFSTDNKSIVINLEGSIESAGAKFTLNQGSLAQINLDSVASRDAFDNDTFEGEIISGELTLDLTLEQKASAASNPITFTGMLNTKLLPFNERVLNEHVEWDQHNQQDNYTYGRPEIETFALPEIVSLSGAFSSFEGDLLKATLTVNIDNLEGYEAPQFTYLGKEVSDLLNITVSTDKNTIVITEADNVSDEQQSTETRIFMPGSQVGEWTATSSVVTEDPNEHYWGTGIERKVFSRRFDVEGIDEKGLLYTRAFVNGAGKSGVNEIRFTPVDTSGDSTADHYKVEQIHTWDDLDYDRSSLSTLTNSDGDLLLADGTLHNWDNAWYMGEFNSVDDFINTMDYQLIANPLTVNNGAELLAQTIDNWWNGQRNLTITELGQVTFFFNEDELAEIAKGEFTELNPIAYLTQPLIKDAATVEVSTDANSVMTTLGNSSWSTTFAFTGAGNSFGDFESLTVFTNGNFTKETKLWSEATDIGLDIPEIVVSINIIDIYSENDQWQDNSQYKITPMDDDGDNIADYVSVTKAYGDHFTTEGVLVEEDGTTEAGFYNNYGSFSYATDTMYANISQLLSFNPLTLGSALELVNAKLASNDSQIIRGWADDIGQLEVHFSEDDINSITAGSTLMFDAINTKAESRVSSEDENTFIDINAALTLEAILGDYQVKVQLAGERTTLQNGDFDLDMSYRLPGEATQRSFTVQYNTDVESRLTANNADGVVLVLNEPNEGAKGTQVIGQILVGPTAIVAATIEDRNGLVVIVYADTDGDGIHDEETL
jgi:hypothetical protein